MVVIPVVEVVTGVELLVAVFTVLVVITVVQVRQTIEYAKSLFLLNLEVHLAVMLRCFKFE